MRNHSITGAAALALLLSACAGGNFRPVADTPVRIGFAYTIRGATYVPAAAPAYDSLGYASWYGSESGKRTANGEQFRPGWVTAAHTTLPLPTYVEVTALDTGRRIIVRVNDRGPFAQGRIIDLSRGAAEQMVKISSASTVFAATWAARAAGSLSTVERSSAFVGGLGPKVISAMPPSNGAATPTWSQPLTSVAQIKALGSTTPNMPFSSWLRYCTAAGLTIAPIFAAAK